MAAQKRGSIYLYDVDGEGACVMHFACAADEGVYVMLGERVMHPDFFAQQQAMHAKSGHTLVMEEENYGRTLWSVRIGRGDFLAMLSAVAMALDGMPGIDQRGGFDASKN